MKLSLASKSNTILFYSNEETTHLGVEVNQSETVMIYHGSKFIVVTALENGFYVEERNAKKNETGK